MANEDTKKRYMVVGGNPIKAYTGTITFTALRVISRMDTLEEVKACVDKEYENCSGLILAVDTDTGESI